MQKVWCFFWEGCSFDDCHMVPGGFDVAVLGRLVMLLAALQVWLVDRSSSPCEYVEDVG